MAQFHCDVCHCVLEAGRDIRYVVRLEVFPALDPVEESDAVDDRDYLMEVDDSLSALAPFDLNEPDDDLYQELQFTLCPECRQRLAKNPLGAAIPRTFEFSEN
ncbi:MAG: hypothetical protein MPJ50_07600 [Pirellulales bacterium]|nr:hypothetical protein [Pirellulales bacterium]